MKSIFERGVRKLIGKRAGLWVRFGFQTAEQKRIRKGIAKMYAHFLKKRDLYFDVGSNYGQKIEPLIGGRVIIIAIEPQTQCCDYLKNVFGKKVTVLECGVGAAEEQRVFYESSAHPLSTFSLSWMEAVKQTHRFAETRWEERGFKKLVTLDYLISIYGEPAFIKIDVEGFEAEVLKGLSKSVKALAFEYTVPERMDSLLECLAIIESLYEHPVWFNYSVGDSLEWTSPEWLNYDKMKEEISSLRFKKSSSGDIYVCQSLPW